MSIPSWATSMVGNYRDMFKQKHGRDCTLTDSQVYGITNDVHDDSSNSARDEARVEAMQEMEEQVE